ADGRRQAHAPDRRGEGAEGAHRGARAAGGGRGLRAAARHRRAGRDAREGRSARAGDRADRAPARLIAPPREAPTVRFLATPAAPGLGTFDSSLTFVSRFIPPPGAGVVPSERARERNPTPSSSALRRPERTAATGAPGRPDKEKFR